MGEPNNELSEGRPEDITTLHISKLPDDFKERELFLLYGTMTGFQNGQIVYGAPGRTLGFATFSNRENAARALERTNGMVWAGAPPEFSLRVGFASSQSRNVKTDQSVSSNRPPVKAESPGWSPGGMDNRSHAVAHYSPQGSFQGPTTLFVRNISENMDTAQLKLLFQRYGEVTRLTRQDTALTKAWVCFANSTSANSALQMNGYQDNTYQPTPLHVSFAKADTRTRVDSHDLHTNTAIQSAVTHGMH
eukprot:TRINITY_DN12298_c0_g2_i1.p1 TRINITY_DN12298_c0_g2~~TRINITY_DN12298_c0_g2_i1.p1  ORF type:complete len:248 (+),score=26.23 TRINITY_DN12298_c0_g2_i1:356-1099(+)